jgi:hypothetical protein
VISLDSSGRAELDSRSWMMMTAVLVRPIEATFGSSDRPRTHNGQPTFELSA